MGGARSGLIVSHTNKALHGKRRERKPQGERPSPREPSVVLQLGPSHTQCGRGSRLRALSRRSQALHASVPPAWPRPALAPVREVRGAHARSPGTLGRWEKRSYARQLFRPIAPVPRLPCGPALRREHTPPWLPGFGAVGMAEGGSVPGGEWVCESWTPSGLRCAVE